MKIVMKHTIPTLLCGTMTALLLMLSGCRTTEANYRASYERAVAHQNAGATTEELRAVADVDAVPFVTYRGDSIPMRSAYLTQFKAFDPAKIKGQEPAEPPARRYNVAVARFKQMFNGRDATRRLRLNGFPDAILLRDHDQTYFVVCQSTDTLSTAVEELRRLQADPSELPLNVKAPFPYILQKL